MVPSSARRRRRRDAACTAASGSALVDYPPIGVRSQKAQAHPLVTHARVGAMYISFPLPHTTNGAERELRAAKCCTIACITMGITS